MRAARPEMVSMLLHSRKGLKLLDGDFPVLVGIASREDPVPSKASRQHCATDARTLHEEQGDRIALDQRAMAREATSVRCALVPTMAGNTNEPRWLREDSCGGMLGGHSPHAIQPPRNADVAFFITKVLQRAWPRGQLRSTADQHGSPV
jgi:hypothetical protein